jgi:site-specific recombinase XerD
MKFDSTLGRALYRRLGVLATTLRPSTVHHYRCTLRRFLSYLEVSFPSLRRPDQLRRDPHIRGWIASLAQRRPPLSTEARLGHLLCLRRLLDELADLPHPPRPGLIHSEDLPRRNFHLPRPLPVEDDQRLQQQLGATNDLLSNALLLLRGTGLRIGELVDLAHDCLHQIGGEHWAIRVPAGKLHRERWVPVEASLRLILARLRFLRTLPPARPEEPFLLPRPAGRSVLLRRLRQALQSAALAAGCASGPVPH